MKAKLFKNALISSPIFAIYGIAPIYVFNNISAYMFLSALAGLTVSIFIFWIINIYLLGFTANTYKRYTLSYLLTSLLHISLSAIARSFPGAPENTFSLIFYPLIAILAINTIILIIINATVFQHQKEAAELEVKNLKVSNLEAQKQILLQQLQPHFLFNALSTLKSLIQESVEDAQDYTIKLSDFLRYSVSPHSQDLVLLKEELKFTNDYIDLQKVRFGEALICEINIAVNMMTQKIPAFSLQTLVENAIKHTKFTDKIPLRITIESYSQSITVRNNKLIKQLVNVSGTGLYNLNERYKIIVGNEIHIDDTDQSFSVTLKLLN